MPKPTVTHDPKEHPGDALGDLHARLAELRNELVVASEVLSDSAFSRCEISAQRDVSAVLVLERAVRKLAVLENDLDTITVEISHPRAVARLRSERRVVANG